MPQRPTASYTSINRLSGHIAAFFNEHFVAAPWELPLEHIRVPPGYRPYDPECGYSAAPHFTFAYDLERHGRSHNTRRTGAHSTGGSRQPDAYVPLLSMTDRMRSAAAAGDFGPDSPIPPSPTLSATTHREDEDGFDNDDDSARAIVLDGEHTDNVSDDQADAYRRRAAELAECVPHGTLVGGHTWDELALYEKKSMLVGRELDNMGMGRYQWCIFFLCGFGYFLDLCWAQATGLVASAIQQELGVTDGSIGNLSVAFNTGLCVGAFFWGLAVDVFGRRWCFNLTCLFASVFGFLFAAPSNFGAICLFNALIGFGVGGNVPIDATITLEFLPANRRYLLAALSTFQPIGVVVASLISWGLVPRYACDSTGALPSCVGGERPCCTRGHNMGWRYTMIVLGTVTLFIFICRFMIFKFQESPKYLLVKGHDAHALDSLYAVARFNSQPQPALSLDDFQALDYEDAQRPRSATAKGKDKADSVAPAAGVLRANAHKMLGHLRRLVDGKTALWLFASMAVAYMSLFWAFAIAGQFLPLILRARGVDTDMSVSETYKSYVWIYLPGVTATLVAASLMGLPRSAFKWTMVVAAAFMGASLVLYQVVDSRAAVIACNALAYWFQSLYTALLYAYTPQAFAAPVRGSASGILSTLGRVASIVAPLAAGTVYHGGSSPGVLYLAGGAAWVSMLAIATLPYDSKGEQSA